MKTYKMKITKACGVRGVGCNEGDVVEVTEAEALALVRYGKGEETAAEVTRSLDPDAEPTPAKKIKAADAVKMIEVATTVEAIDEIVAGANKAQSVDDAALKRKAELDALGA